MGLTRVDVSITGGIAWITLDGPTRRNALDQAAVADLIAACDKIDADPTVGVAVISGAGPAFCSGADRGLLDGLRTATPEVRDHELRALYAGFLRFGALAVPTVAALNGPAVGAGLNLALAADLRVMTTNAVLVSGFSQIGIHPGGGHLHLLARSAGASVASAMGVFALPMSAERAVTLGLAWAAVEPAELRLTVEAMVAHLAADPDLARALATSLRQTILATGAWDRAVELERDRQAWSLARPRKED